MLVVVERSSGSSVRLTELLIGRISSSWYFPQYLISAMLGDVVTLARRVVLAYIIVKIYNQAVVSTTQPTNCAIVGKGHAIDTSEGVER